MVDAIAPWDRLVVQRMCRVNAAQVHAADQGIGPRLVVGINSADRAEIMARRMRAEAVAA